MKQKTQAVPPWKTAVAACVLVSALAVSLSLAWRYRDLPHLGHMHDDTLYLVSATSLAEGGGHRIASLPGSPWQTKYPPLYPALLAPLIKAYPEFPGEPSSFGIWLWLLLPVFGLSSWMLCRSLDLPAVACWAITTLVLLNPYLVYFSITPMTELPLGILVIWVCVSVQKRQGALASACAGLAGGIGFLIRSAALPLLFAVPVWQLSRKRPRDAAWFFAAMSPFVVGWMWWSASHRNPSADLTVLYYIDYFGYYRASAALSDIPVLLWRNLDAMLLGVGRLVLFDLSDSGPGKFLMQVLGIGCLSGVVKLVRERGWFPFAAFSVASAPMLLFWNFPPNERFLAGFAPLFLIGGYREGMHVLGMARRNLGSERKGERAAAILAIGCLSGLLLFGLWRSVYGVTVHFPRALSIYREARDRRKPLFRFIAANTPANATFATSYDGLLYLQTRRRGCRMMPNVMWRYRGEEENLRAFYASLPAFARSHNLSHILLTPEDFGADLTLAEYRAILDSISKDPSWERIYRSGDYAVFRDRRAAIR